MPKLPRKITLILLLIAVFSLLQPGIFLVQAHSLNPSFYENITGQKVETHHDSPSSPSATPPISKQKNIENRPFSRTLTSFPEWYIVYSAQEYADFVQAGNFPDEFPWFRAVGQYWSSLRQIEQALPEGVTIDDDTHTVLNVIGASFTAEYILIGTFENTLGWFSKTLNFHTKTPEDYFYDKISEEYGEFLNQTPWYQFPYFSKIRMLWTNVRGTKSLTFRGIKRRLALTLGYTGKGAYGFSIRKATEISYDPASTSTSFIVSDITINQLREIDEVKIVNNNSGKIEAVAPRYRAFKEPVLKILRNGGTLQSIEGNENIMITAIVQEGSTCTTATEQNVLRLPVLTQDNRVRIGVLLPVTKLEKVVEHLQSCGSTVEHIYDY